MFGSYVPFNKLSTFMSCLISQSCVHGTHCCDMYIHCTEESWSPETRVGSRRRSANGREQTIAQAALDPVRSCPSRWAMAMNQQIAKLLDSPWLVCHAGTESSLWQLDFTFQTFLVDCLHRLLWAVSYVRLTYPNMSSNDAHSNLSLRILEESRLPNIVESTF